MVLNSFINEIRKQIQAEFKYATDYMVNDHLVSMFVLKYYCDNGKYSYQEKTEGNIKGGIQEWRMVCK